MHVILKITPKQEIILGSRLGLTPVFRDEETEMTIFEIEQSKKSWRAQLELEKCGAKSLNSLLLFFNNPATCYKSTLQELPLDIKLIEELENESCNGA